MKLVPASSLAALLSAFACDTRLPPEKVFLQSFSVRIRESTGSLSSPLPSAATATATFTLDVQALGSDGVAFPYNGTVYFTGAPGTVDPCSAIVVNGVLTGQIVTLVRSYGRATINVFSGEYDCQTAATLDKPLKPRAIGSSQPIFLPNLSVAEVQGTAASPFVRQAVRIDQGTLIVTHVSQDGFYVSDSAQPNYGSIFAYTHSRPDDLLRGDRLLYLAGGIGEFPNNTSNGFTEVNFPSWAVDRSCGTATCDVGWFCVNSVCRNPQCGSIRCNAGEVCVSGACAAMAAIPVADLLSSTVVGSSSEMEKRESSFVRVERVKVATQFKNCDLNSSGTCDFCRYCNVDADCTGATQGGRCVSSKCDCDANTLNEDSCASACDSDPTCSSECDFKEYGQWKVTLDSGAGSAVLVVSRDTVPGFDPKQSLGVVLKSVQGMLRDVPGKPGWVIESRDPRDLTP